MSKLLDYLNALDKDAQAREAHNADPQTAMTNFGLSEVEQQALLSGDPVAIAQAVGIELNDMPSVQITNGQYRKPD